MKTYVPDPEKLRANWGKYNAKSKTKLQKRNWYMWNKYKITDEIWTALLDAQGYACAICGLPWEVGQERYWHVDHNHACCDSDYSCGECIRGILCHMCNKGLGHFQDDVRRLSQAAEYLRLQEIV